MFGIKIPQSIFVHADGFLRASAPKSDPPNPYDMAALVTNSAIASELYLKCLIHLETGQLVKNQHNLKKLFGMLRQETQEMIQARFDAALGKQKEYDYSNTPVELKEDAQAVAQNMPKNLKEALKKGAGAFVEWRYLYEDESESGNPFSLFYLPSLLRAVILERKPEWGMFGFKMTKVAPVLSTSRAQ